MKKKSIYELREELIDAESQFEILHVYGDHAVIILSYAVLNPNKKKQELTEYIEKTFAAILHVDVFTQYLVIWHEFAILAPEHRKIKRPQ